MLAGEDGIIVPAVAGITIHHYQNEYLLSHLIGAALKFVHRLNNTMMSVHESGFIQGTEQYNTPSHPHFP